ncbi:siderophore-interacting protein [Glutamicibacter sp. 287]|uniref:siderophore-interacting protein n=1 Tax=Micrococcaceae TaxID=1268 RepID=UPI002158377C|nr:MULTISPECIES: siderophore-interacting protein [unclassified Arthrobacter]
MRPQVVLQVVKRQQISEHLVRLTFGGPGFENFVDKSATDRYIKILFAKPELGLTLPYDMDELRERLPGEDMPVRRTYTVRRSDAAAGTIEVDFVVHGSDGLAGPWARDAKIGDSVCFSGPGGMYEPKGEFDFHLLVGDETAIPAIAASLEAMREDMVGQVLIEVEGAGDEIEMRAPRGVDIRWIHRGAAFTPEASTLESAVRQHPWPGGRVQVFAHGEREVMKALRSYFYDERGVDRRDMSLSAYWAFGRAEDVFQAEKRTPVGQIFNE